MSKIRVAFIGCGGIAGKHSNRLKGNADVQIVAGCDVSAAIVTKFFERTLSGYTPAPKVFTDLKRMYKAAKPNAVVICTPHTLHYAQAIQALDNGCHVLMEKPMVTSAEHAYKIREKVEKTGKVFTIAYNTPCSPEFQYLRELIRTQALGKLELVTGYLSQDWLRFTVGSWRQNPKLSGGGQAYDSGAHLLNSLCWSVESRPGEVFAFVDNCGTPVDINSAFVIRFENGVMASIAVSGNCPGGSSHMSFFFSGGRIEIDPWGAGWIRIFKGADLVKYPPIAGKPLDPSDNFIDAIRGRDTPRTTPLNGIIHSELMDAVYESARTGKVSRPKHR